MKPLNKSKIKRTTKLLHSILWPQIGREKEKEENGKLVEKEDRKRKKG